MTAAELAQAFRDAGDRETFNCMVALLSDPYGVFETAKRETAALAIAEARVREMWFAKYKNPAAFDFAVSHFHDGNVDIVIQTTSETLFVTETDMPHADAIHVALQAALETTDE